MTSKENERNLRDAARDKDISTIKDLIGRGTNLNATESVSMIV